MPAVAVKVAVLAVAATVTDGGTVNAALLLERAIVAPPVGAAWLSVTVQVVELLEVNVVGLQETEESSTETAKEIVAFCEEPFKVAVTTAV